MITEQNEQQFLEAFLLEVLYQSNCFDENNGYEQKSSWQDGELNFQVDVYEGPHGKGFIFIAFKIEGDMYIRKEKNIGNENRSKDWSVTNI